MDKKTLESFGQLRAALELLNIEIDDITAALRAITLQSDVVQGSSPHFPYTQHGVAITGIAPTDTGEANTLRDALTDAKQRRLSLRRDYINRFSDIDFFLFNVKDIELKRILSYRYVDGLSWVAVADKMQLGVKYDATYTADGCRVRVDRYLTTEPKAD